MDTSVKGRVIAEAQRTVIEQKLDEVATALGTPTAAETARLVPYFGPTFIGGEGPFIDAIGIDEHRALLAGIEYEWTRPFEVGETINFKAFVEDAYEKSNMLFVIVVSEFTDTSGELIQRHRATFVER